MVHKRTLELGELDDLIRTIETRLAHGCGNRRGCSPIGDVLPGVLAGIPGMLIWLQGQRRDAVEVLLLEQHTSWALDRWLGWFGKEVGPLAEDDRTWIQSCVAAAVISSHPRAPIRAWYRKARSRIPPRSRGSAFLEVVKSALSPGKCEQGLLFA